VTEKALNVACGINMYKTGQEKLQVAITEYDQAVFDFTSSVVTNTASIVTGMASEVTSMCNFIRGMTSRFTV